MGRRRPTAADVTAAEARLERIKAELDSAEQRYNVDGSIARTHHKDMELVWKATLDEHVEVGGYRSQARRELRRARRAGDTDRAIEITHWLERFEAERVRTRLALKIALRAVRNADRAEMRFIRRGISQWGSLWGRLIVESVRYSRAARRYLRATADDAREDPRASGSG